MWKKTCSVITVLVMFFSIPFLTEGAEPLNVGSPTRGSLMPHDPIVIEGNANFTTANGVRSGSGTKSDPYIISGWDIDPIDLVPCIRVANTTAYFTITKCDLHHSTLSKGNPTHEEYNYLNGLVLLNVENADIESNMFYDNGALEIYLRGSNRNILRGNKLNSQIIYEHLLMDYSSYNLIDFNEIDPLVPYKSVSPLRTVPFAARGIDLLEECMHNQISNNTIKNHCDSGIEISSNYNLHNRIVYNIITDNCEGLRDAGLRSYVEDNIVIKNTASGIFIEGDAVRYKRNLIADNGENGFDVSWGRHYIEGNIIRGNGKNGIFLKTSSSVINNNIITENNIDGIQIQGPINKIYSNIIRENHVSGISIVNNSIKPNGHEQGLNSICLNNFIDNGNGSNTQAIDDDKHPGINWSDFSYRFEGFPNQWSSNYWNDHNGPDEDADDVVDVPYNISGEAGVNDSEPMVGPYTINVTGPIFPLRIITSDKISVKAGTEYSVKYEVTADPSRSNITWSMRTNASWLSFSKENILHGEPDLVDIGVYWVNVSVSDGKKTDRHVFNIYVYETTDPTIGPTGNVTEPKNNDTEPKNETENQPPQGGQILLPPGEMHEGDELVFSTFVYDPDLKENESLNYTWYIVGIGIVGYGSKIEITLTKNNYTIIVNVTDPNGATVTIEKTIQILDKGQVIYPGVGTKSDKAWWESPWIIASIVLLTNLMIIAFFGFVMVFRERTPHETALSPESYYSGLGRRILPKGPIISGPLRYSADGILSSIVEKGGISEDHEGIDKIRSGAESLYKEGKITRKTYGIIRRNLHGSQKEE